jgi:hypothetical protein
MRNIVMTKARVPRKRGEHSPQHLLDLRLFVLVVVAGVVTWLAFTNPALATAIGFGLATLYALHRLIGH